MDLRKSSEKFEAKKNQKKGGCFVYYLMLYSVAGLACSLFCSGPYWFSSVGCSMKQYLFIYFPYICSSCCNSKWLFIIVNVIIVFLVSESNFLSSSANSSPAGDFYDEYVERCRRIRGTSAGSTYPEKKATFPEKKEEKNPHVQMKLIEQKIVNSMVDEVKHVKRIETEKHEEEEKQKEKERDEEEEGALPAEELNKRVEEFIARVNKQRWLEAKSLVCCWA